MAIELFKPFIIRELVKQGYAQNVKSAKRKIENKEVAVFDVLEKVINGHPVMLNRAPTLHRLGIQAFEPILVEGKAIQIHPLVCTAFNADFDGDQMAVHVPLSLEAQSECRILIMSSNNVLSPSNGKPIITPTQDMIIGLYCMTMERNDENQKALRYFDSMAEALKAYELAEIKLQARMIVRYNGQRLETTIGRLIFNDTVNGIITHFDREPYPYIHDVIGKKKLAALISEWYDKYGTTISAELCDRIKDLGFHFATEVGLSLAIEDMVVPSTKADIVNKAEKEQKRLESLYKNGSITNREMREKLHDVWRQTTGKVTDEMLSQMGKYNSIFIMANSGARGNIDQVRQLAGMRGLMADASGNTIDIPIKSNFREGLSITEYFISCYGARKGVVDTALRTADSGYLTRRLVDVAQDVMITEIDCGTKESITMSAIKDGYKIVLPLEERIVGRYSAETIKDPASGESIVKKGEEITMSVAKKIVEAGYEEIKVRSVLTCKSQKGICQKCYGIDLSSRNPVNIGEAVGIIAAQSIGEPGTQLTMRTFHTGGVDLTKAMEEKIVFTAKYDGEIEYDESVKQTTSENDRGEKVKVLVRDCRLLLKRPEGINNTYDIPSGGALLVRNGQKVKKGTALAEFYPNYQYIIAVNEGEIQYIGFKVEERTNDEGKKELFARNDGEAFIHNSQVYKDYLVPTEAEIYVEKNERVRIDEELAVSVFSESAGRVLDIIDTDKGKIIRLAPGENFRSWLEPVYNSKKAIK
jgi:DNA-directed RNA polymerase subunit beta'